jgi:hypothetical protein
MEILISAEMEDMLRKWSWHTVIYYPGISSGGNRGKTLRSKNGFEKSSIGNGPDGDLKGLV